MLQALVALSGRLPGEGLCHAASKPLGVDGLTTTPRVGMMAKSSLDKPPPAVLNAIPIAPGPRAPLLQERPTVKEKVLMAIAWRLPRSVVYWCAIRLMANATQGSYSNQIVPELTAIDALKRW